MLNSNNLYLILKGNDVSAIKSVPAAIYSFLRTVEKPAEGWEKPVSMGNKFSAIRLKHH